MDIDETNNTYSTVTEREHEFIQCAACGHEDLAKNFYNSSIHSNFKICPECGTVRYLCFGNAHFRK